MGGTEDILFSIEWRQLNGITVGRDMLSVLGAGAGTMTGRLLEDRTGGNPLAFCHYCLFISIHSLANALTFCWLRDGQFDGCTPMKTWQSVKLGQMMIELIWI